MPSQDRQHQSGASPHASISADVCTSPGVAPDAPPRCSRHARAASGSTTITRLGSSMTPSTFRDGGRELTHAGLHEYMRRTNFSSPNLRRELSRHEAVAAMTSRMTRSFGSGLVSAISKPVAASRQRPQPLRRLHRRFQNPDDFCAQIFYALARNGLTDPGSRSRPSRPHVARPPRPTARDCRHLP